MRCARAPPAPTDPADRLNRAGLAYADFARRQPGALRAELRVHEAARRARRRAKPAAADDSFNDLVALVLDYLAEDDPRRDEADFLARGIWSGLHGYVSLSQTRTGMGWPREDEFVARLAQRVAGRTAPRAAAIGWRRHGRRWTGSASADIDAPLSEVWAVVEDVAVGPAVAGRHGHDGRARARRPGPGRAVRDRHRRRARGPCAAPCASSTSPSTG